MQSTVWARVSTGQRGQAKKNKKKSANWFATICQQSQSMCFLFCLLIFKHGTLASFILCCRRFVSLQMVIANTLFKTVCYHPDINQIITSGTDRKVTDTTFSGLIQVDPSWRPLWRPLMLPLVALTDYDTFLTNWFLADASTKSLNSMYIHSVSCVMFWRCVMTKILSVIKKNWSTFAS